MSHLLIIGFANEQKAKEGADKLLTLQKRGQIEIEDAVIGTKSESGAVALTQLSNASSFWEVRAAASGYPVSPVAGALTDFGSDGKVREGDGRSYTFGQGGGICSRRKKAERQRFRRFDRRSGGVFRLF
jgi:hypothetical protein